MQSKNCLWGSLQTKKTGKEDHMNLDSGWLLVLRTLYVIVQIRAQELHLYFMHAIPDCGWQLQKL